MKFSLEFRTKIADNEEDVVNILKILDVDFFSESWVYDRDEELNDLRVYFIRVELTGEHLIEFLTMFNLREQFANDSLNINSLVNSGDI
jgi:hypothetical protein